ncbi:MAG: DUF6678 family protein [Bacteroidota bacterium]
MSVPTAASVPDGDDLTRIRRVVAERGLVGLANDTKWNELLAVMRARRTHVPAHRWKRIDADHVTRWDSEWFYHLPTPFVSCEWLDIRLVREVRQGRLVPPRRIEHGDWIESALDRIGFDWIRHGDVARIFGYAPRSLEGLD